MLSLFVVLGAVFGGDAGVIVADIVFGSPIEFKKTRVSLSFPPSLSLSLFLHLSLPLSLSLPPSLPPPSLSRGLDVKKVLYLFHYPR